MTESFPDGTAVDNWTPRNFPERVVHSGRTVRLEPLDPTRHEDDLWESAQAANLEPGFWNYLPYGPYTDRSVFERDMAANAASSDPLYYAVINLRTGKAEGVATLMRMDVANGSIEVGHIWFGPALQRSTAATEAIYLLGDYVFTTLGYRRFEWKCNSLNAPSIRAAERFGFVYEGTFRNHLVTKGHNRDTAWFSMIDREWPVLRAAFETWLNPANFDNDNQQIQRLKSIRQPTPVQG